jgi:hypothetical protein
VRNGFGVERIGLERADGARFEVVDLGTGLQVVRGHRFGIYPILR